MTVFLVSTKYVADDEALKARITEVFPNDNYEIGRGQWLVGSKGSARQIYEKLLPDDEPSGVIVLRTAGYWGIAPEDLWEWVATETKKDAAAEGLH